MRSTEKNTNKKAKLVKPKQIKPKSKTVSEKLLPLLSASLALPGLSLHANEQGYRTETPVVSLYHAQYSESDGRMDAEVSQISFVTPLFEKAELELKTVKDVLSGASPSANLLDSNMQPVQILEAGASIKDVRDVYEAKTKYYAEDYTAALGLGYSKEDDYTSRFISADVKIPFNEKNTNVNLGVAYAKDTVSNVYEADVFFNEPTKFNKRKKIDFLLGVEQLLNKNSFFSLNLLLSHSSGNLSDPYKKVSIQDEALLNIPADAVELFANSDFANDNFIGQLLLNFLNDNEIEDFESAVRWFNESGLALVTNTLIEDIDFLTLDRVIGLGGIASDLRPDKRDQAALTASYSRYIEKANAGLHIDYRFAYDDWGANSHTFETKWKQDLGSGWMLSPGLRYYTQDNVDFYNVVFETRPNDGVFTSDYRLSSFGSLSKKLEISKQFNSHISVNVNYEHYDRRYDWGLYKNRGSSIEDFTAQTWAVNVNYAF